MTPKQVVESAREKGVKIVDLRFIDLPGIWQHFSIPVRDLGDDLFTEGIGFDGSSIRGFQQIQESDMLLMPDPTSAFVDPFTAAPTLNLICDVADPLTQDQQTVEQARGRRTGRWCSEPPTPLQAYPRMASPY